MTHPDYLIRHAHVLHPHPHAMVPVAEFGLPRVLSALTVAANAPHGEIDFASEPVLRGGTSPSSTGLVRATAAARMLMLGLGSFVGDSTLISACVAMLNASLKFSDAGHRAEHADLQLADIEIRDGARPQHVALILTYASRETSKPLNWDRVARDIATDTIETSTVGIQSAYKQATAAATALSRTWGQPVVETLIADTAAQFVELHRER